MPGLGDLFGRGSIAEQIFVWGVLNNVISAVGSPFFAQLTYLINDAHPVVELTPADLALMVVRNVRTRDAAASEAQRSGLNGSRFDELVAITGDAPAPGELAVGLRRGLIPEHGTGPGSTSFDQGIREGRLKDKWIDLFKGLAQQWPSPTDALDARLKGQVSDADGRALYERFGGAPQYYDLLFNTQGEGPSPVEAGQMANRGLIPWTGTGAGVVSFEQAFHESRWRNKWEPAFRGIAEYRPPPRTITALLRAGSITDAEARALLAQSGMRPDLIAAYIADATRTRTATAKELTESQIVTLYEAHALTQSEAVQLLGKLGMSAHDAALALTAAGVRVQVAQVSSAVSKVRASFLARHIDAGQASKALGAIGVSGPAVSNMMRVWGAELTATPAVLTAAEVTGAVFYGIIPVAEGLTRLEHRGYSPRDAWIMLSVRSHTKLPGEPPA